MNLLRRILARFVRVDITDERGSVYMRRWTLLRLPWGRVYLHEILRSDRDRCLHDHPWRFVTLILAGGYREQLAGGHSRWRGPGTLLSRRARFAHRVELAEPGRTAWSLVLVGRRVRAWGFWTPRGWRPFRAGWGPVCEEQVEFLDPAKLPGDSEFVAHTRRTIDSVASSLGMRRGGGA